MSTRLTSSSRIVPTMPGCTPAGGVNCTATVGLGPTDDDRHLLVDARGQARGQPGVLLVAAAAPHEQPHQGPGEQRQEHGEADREPAERPGQAGADDAAGVGVGGPLAQVGGQVAEGVARVGGEHARALLGREVGDGEGAGRAGLTASHGVGGAEVAVEARGPRGGDRAGHRGRHLLLREAVGGVDHVVVELRRAVADVVDDVGQPVAHHVVGGAGDGLRGAADRGSAGRPRSRRSRCRSVPRTAR